MEEWKVITFAPKYEVSNKGRIRNRNTIGYRDGDRTNLKPSNLYRY